MVCAPEIALPWTARSGARLSPGTRDILIDGAGLGLFGLLAFGTAHHFLIVPIWTQLVAGLPFTLAAGIAFAWGFEAVAQARGSRSLAAGVQFGAAMVCSLVPATLFDATLRLMGVRMQDSIAGASAAVAIAIASGGAAGWLLTRRSGQSWAFAAATLMMTLAAGGPLPVTQSTRGVWLSFAFVPICLAAGVSTVLIRALRARVRRQDTP